MGVTQEEVDAINRLEWGNARMKQAHSLLRRIIARPRFTSFEYNHNDMQATGVVSINQAMIRGRARFVKLYILSGAPKIAQPT
jgi:hypothetical protein